MPAIVAPDAQVATAFLPARQDLTIALISEGNAAARIASQGDRQFIVLWDPCNLFEGEVFAFDGEEVRWSRRVFDFWLGLTTQGQQWHEVSLHVNGNSVVVLGIDDFVAYMNELDAQTGELISRFSTLDFSDLYDTSRSKRNRAPVIHRSDPRWESLSSRDSE